MEMFRTGDCKPSPPVERVIRRSQNWGIDPDDATASNTSAKSSLTRRLGHRERGMGVLAQGNSGGANYEFTQPRKLEPPAGVRQFRKRHDVTDLVERLRLFPYLRPSSPHADELTALVYEAAVEIERLRKATSLYAMPVEPLTIDWIDWQRQVIFRNGIPIHLTSSQWLIFARLVKNTGKLVTKKELFNEIYSLDPNGGAGLKIIDVFVCKLRKKCPWPITTVWGRGYIIEGCQSERRVMPSPRAVLGITRERLMAGR
jgi:hypothetical protein